MTAIEPALSRQQQPARLKWEDVSRITGYDMGQLAMLRHNMATSLGVEKEKVPLEDLLLFAHSAQSLGLDPIIKQVHWIRRQGKGTLQIGIDGLRAIAARAGDYAGSAEPIFRGRIEYSWSDGPTGNKLVVPEYCQVIARKIVQGHVASFVGEARWTEFVPAKFNEAFQWRKMPYHMMAIRAESHALRKGWALQMGGVEVSTDRDESAHVVEMRPPSTATEYTRIHGTESDWDQAQSAAPALRAPVDLNTGEVFVDEVADEVDETLPFESAIVEDTSGLDPHDYNHNLVKQAGPMGIRGLDRLTAQPDWPEHATVAANVELETRIRASLAEAEAVSAR